eukprot:scaffold10585_cov122-Isochrysis_galbana.AAC.4
MHERTPLAIVYPCRCDLSCELLACRVLRAYMSRLSLSLYAVRCTVHLPVSYIRIRAILRRCRHGLSGSALCGVP